MKMMIDEYEAMPLTHAISLLDVMVDLGASQPPVSDTVQLNLNSLIDTLFIIRNQLKAVESKLVPADCECL